MSQHIQHLVTAYVHRQLSPTKRNQVLLHIQKCVECRSAVEREAQFARDLKLTMPKLGLAESNRLSGLWPAIWAEVRKPQAQGAAYLKVAPSYGMALLALLLACVFITSAFFNRPNIADAKDINGAPTQFQPSDVRATWTPMYTDHPATEVSELPAQATAANGAINNTSTIVDVRLRASPVPAALMISQR